jgi:hypothetical protein
MTRFVEYPPLRKATFILAAASTVLTACGTFGQLSKVVVTGDNRALRERPSGQPSNAPSRPALLILAIDGLGRDLLYSMLGSGELPELAALIGKSGSSFPHAYFAPDVLTTVPSTTGGGLGHHFHRSVTSRTRLGFLWWLPTPSEVVERRSLPLDNHGETHSVRAPR